MRSLFLIRHAKADVYSLSGKDFDRDLQAKGIQRAKNIALALKEELPKDMKLLLISSSANRAIQTAKIFASLIDYPEEKIQQTEALYEAHFIDILKVINEVEEQFHTVLVFGHNPGISNLVNYLSHAEVALSTSHVAQLQLDDEITFKMLSGGTTQLIGILAE